jgi:hypothetical protein
MRDKHVFGIVSTWAFFLYVPGLVCVCVCVCVCVEGGAGLAWQIINDLWLHPCVHLDASHEDRSPFFLPPAHTLELIRQADAILSKEPNILNIEGPTKLFGAQPSPTMHTCVMRSRMSE